MYLCPEIQTIKIMSTYTEDTRKVTTHRLMEMKLRGEKISMLTDFTYYSRPNDLSWEVGCPSR